MTLESYERHEQGFRPPTLGFRLSDGTAASVHLVFEDQGPEAESQEPEGGF
jgi:hypothetical protein